jgi:8-oxo-dGTP diphosphatase
MSPPVKRSVSLALHDADGRVLQVQRPPDDEDLPGVWGLPAASLREGEGWEDAVRRAARDKLDLAVVPGLVLRSGSRDRPGYRLEMRLYEARIAAPDGGVAPRLEGRDPAVTRYTAWRWGTAEGLRPAADRGSLCSILYLGAPEEGSGSGPESRFGSGS